MKPSTENMIRDELANARDQYPAFPGLHHGLGVLDEEVHELRLEIYKRASQRDTENLRREAIQVIAMCIRIIEEAT